MKDVSEVLYAKCNNEMETDTDSDCPSKCICKDSAAETSKVHVHKSGENTDNSRQIVVNVNVTVPK